MTVPVDIPQRIKQIVGPLPLPGLLPDVGSSPYETIMPVRDGFVERKGVRTYFAVWGESGPTMVFAPLYQIVHMQLLQSHFEQRIHVQQRLRNYGADCAIEYNTVTPEDLANAALTRMHQPVCYRPVETTGAIQAATIIARVLSARGAVR